MPVAGIFYRSILWRGVFFISAFVLNVLFARHFMASVSGEIFYLISIYSFLILILSLSIESSMGYYVSRDEIPLAKLINFCIVWTIAVLVLVFISAEMFSNGKSLSAFVFITVSFICGNLLANYIAGIFYAKRNYLLPNIIISAINLVLILLLVMEDVFHKNLITDKNYILLFFGSFVLQAVALVLAMMIRYKIKWSLVFPSSIELKKLFRFGLIALTANVLFFLLCRIDYWFVKINCTSEELGNYIQVSKLGQIFFIVPSVLSGAIFPMIAAQKDEDISVKLVMLQRMLFLFYAVCCIVLMLTGNWLFPWVFGSSFSQMYRPFLFLVPGILSLPGLYIFTAHHSGKNKIIINIKGTLLALIIVFFADMLLIPKYGISAAACVSSVGYIIYQLYVLYKFKKQFNQPARDFFLL
jgi:O-antigen/teichoic acid export membrane protein